MINTETKEVVIAGDIRILEQAILNHGWYKIEGATLGTVVKTPLGNLEVVGNDFGRDFTDVYDGIQGHTAETLVVLKGVTTSGKNVFFAVDGNQDSYGQVTWSRRLRQVEAEPKTVTVWSVK